jgi:hypothetical protein
MGWDKGGRYYTRSRREGGRVVREYVGRGPGAELVARLDELERDERETGRQVRRIERERIDALDEPLNELADAAELLVRAVLLAAGFRQHNRGEWRKKRG